MLTNLVNNTSTPAIVAPTAPSTEVIAILMTICILAVFENIFVCCMIFNCESLRTATNVFIFSLCVANLLFASVLIPMHCFAQGKKAYGYLTLIICLIYILNLTAVTAERLISITKPLHYHTIVTKRRAYWIVILSYMIPCSYCLIPISYSSDDNHVAHKGFMTFTMIVFLVCPLVFITWVYIKVCIETRKFFRNHTKLIVVDGKEGATLFQQAKLLCCFEFNTAPRRPRPRISSIISDSSHFDSQIHFDRSASVKSLVKVSATNTKQTHNFSPNDDIHAKGSIVSLSHGKPCILSAHSTQSNGLYAKVLTSTLVHSHSNNVAKLDNAAPVSDSSYKPNEEYPVYLENVKKDSISINGDGIQTMCNSALTELPHDSTTCISNLKERHPNISRYYSFPFSLQMTKLCEIRRLDTSSYIIGKDTSNMYDGGNYFQYPLLNANHSNACKSELHGTCFTKSFICEYFKKVKRRVSLPDQRFLRMMGEKFLHTLDWNNHSAMPTSSNCENIINSQEHECLATNQEVNPNSYRARSSSASSFDSFDLSCGYKSNGTLPEKIVLGCENETKPHGASRKWQRIVNIMILTFRAFHGSKRKDTNDDNYLKSSLLSKKADTTKWVNFSEDSISKEDDYKYPMSESNNNENEIYILCKGKASNQSSIEKASNIQSVCESPSVTFSDQQDFTRQPQRLAKMAISSSFCVGSHKQGIFNGILEARHMKKTSPNPPCRFQTSDAHFNSKNPQPLFQSLRNSQDYHKSDGYLINSQLHSATDERILRNRSLCRENMNYNTSRLTIRSSQSFRVINDRVRHMLRELKSSFAFAIVVFTYMFTWLPVVHMTLMDVIDRQDLISPSLMVISIFTIGLNALVDPLVYGLLLRDFRSVLKNIYRKMNS